MSLHINLDNTHSIKFYKYIKNGYFSYKQDGVIYVEVEGESREGIIDGTCEEISKETLKSYIDKLQELYDSV